MALEVQEHAELGSIIVDDQTGKFVTGFQRCIFEAHEDDAWTEFLAGGDGEIINASDFGSTEEYEDHVQARHTEIVTELEADGFGVTL